MGTFPADVAHTVGSEIRDLIDRLVSRELDDAALARAVVLLREARAALDGPEAPSGAVYTDGDYTSYLHFLDRSAFGGGLNPVAPPIEWDEPADVRGPTPMTARVTIGRAYEGGPGMVHGGYVAGLFDQILGSAQGPRGCDFAGATTTLTVTYHRPVPLYRELTFRAWYDEVDGRRLRGRATCHVGEVLAAEAEGHFLKVDMNSLGRKAQASESASA